ncbi:MAG: hypothetical protein ACR2HJ_06650 [Fimbriimonadales bacterium]
MKKVTSFAKCGLLASLAPMALGLAGCGGSGGGVPAFRDVEIIINWEETEDIDLQAARNDFPFGETDNIYWGNLQGGPPAWGQHSGDEIGEPGSQESITFTANGTEEPYNAYVHGYEVTSGKASVRCRVFFDNEQNPRIDDTYLVGPNEVIHFARIRRDGVTVPPGDVVIKVEKRLKKQAPTAPSAGARKSSRR